MRVILFLVALVLGVLGVGLMVSSGAQQPGATAASPAAAAAADCGAVEFDHYDAGAAVDGIAKARTIRRCEPDVGAPTRINMVAALYGSCEPNGSGARVVRATEDLPAPVAGALAGKLTC